MTTTLPLLPARIPQRVGCVDVNTVYCTDALSLLARLPDNSIDLVVTSPPYDNLREYNGYTFDFQPIARETYRVMKPGGVVVWVVGDATINGSETLTSMRQALYFVDVCGFRMHDTMIYQKDSYPFPDTSRYYQQWEYMFVMSKGEPHITNLLRQKAKYSAPNKSASQRQADGSITKLKYKTANETRVLDNVWPISSGYMRTTADTFAYDHPAMFPEELAERHILTWSNAGDVVLDYFGGSGTTAKMARKLGRDYIYCDVSADYCQIARRRLAQPYTPLMFTDDQLAG